MLNMLLKHVYLGVSYKYTGGFKLTLLLTRGALEGIRKVQHTRKLNHLTMIQ